MTIQIPAHEKDKYGCISRCPGCVAEAILKKVIEMVKFGAAGIPFGRIDPQDKTEWTNTQLAGAIAVYKYILKELEAIK